MTTYEAMTKKIDSLVEQTKAALEDFNSDSLFKAEVCLHEINRLTEIRDALTPEEAKRDFEEAPDAEPLLF